MAEQICEKCKKPFTPKRDYYKLCEACFREEVQSIKQEAIKDFEKNIKRHLRETKPAERSR